MMTGNSWTTHRACARGLALLSCTLALACGQTARAVEDEKAEKDEVEGIEKLSPEALEELVGPIALYPDALIAQILPASTFALDVVQAHRYLEDNGGKADEETIKKLEYDPSVLALMHYPEVLAMLNEDLDWTASLGDAVIVQQEDVMDAVQRFRKTVHDAGNLQTNEQQTVVTEVVEAREVIIIQPTNPEVIYVPTYSPEVVVVEDPSVAAVSFTTGLAVGAWIGYACHWGSYGSCRIGEQIADVEGA